MGLSLSLGLGLNAAGFGMGSRTLDSLFANGENGFLFANMSDLSRAFTTSVGPVNVAANDDPVGLALDNHSWGGKTLAQVLAAQPEIIMTPWSLSANGGTGTATENPAGTLNLIGDGVNSATARSTVATVVGQTYRISVTVTTGAVAVNVGSTAGGQQNANTVVINIGTQVVFFIATAITTHVEIRRTPAILSIASAISCKLVPGNHAINATGTQRPFWKSNSGKPYIVGDKNDDRLSTSVVPTTALTMALSCRLIKDPVLAMIAMGGGSSATPIRSFIGINGGTGQLAIGWGTARTDASGLDRSGQDMVVVVTGDTANPEVYVDGVPITLMAGSGQPGGGASFALCAYNQNGTMSNFSDSRIYAAMVRDRRSTPAEVALITNQLKRTYQ